MEPKIDPASVKGWGIDADPDNDPTYPMRQREQGDGKKDDSCQRPAQPQSVEVLHSNERPNLTSAFGTSAPPSGLSGVIRRRTFRHSESTYSHWLPLMLADRIGIVEGLVDDLLHGHVPKTFLPKRAGPSTGSTTARACSPGSRSAPRWSRPRRSGCGGRGGAKAPAGRRDFPRARHADRGSLRAA